jgi:hypothetical protein
VGFGVRDTGSHVLKWKKSANNTVKSLAILLACLVSVRILPKVQDLVLS